MSLCRQVSSGHWICAIMRTRSSQPELCEQLFFFLQKAADKYLVHTFFKLKKVYQFKENSAQYLFLMIKSEKQNEKKKRNLTSPTLSLTVSEKINQDLSDESLVLMVPHATSWHWTMQCLNIWVIFIIQCKNTSKCLMQLHFYFRFLTAASI